jgi:hypothetical protein
MAAITIFPDPALSSRVLSDGGLASPRVTAAGPLAGRLLKLPRLSGYFHQDKTKIVADNADTLPSVASPFRGLPGSPPGCPCGILAGRQPSPFCCCFPLFAWRPDSDAEKEKEPGLRLAMHTDLASARRVPSPQRGS